MKDFTQGNVFQQLVHFTLPMLLANLLQAAYNVVDGIWVGRLLGPHALAAVSVSAPLMFLLVSAAIGLAMATTILGGQAYGARNHAFLSRLLANSFISTAAMCMVISVTAVVFARDLLHLVNTPPEVMEDAHTFFVVMLVGMIFNFGYNWFSGILRGLGDARTPFILLMGSTVLNVVLVPLLIMGVGPLPALGVAGAGVGTVVANLITLVVAYFAVLRHHPVVGVKGWDFTLDWRIMKQLVVIGVPASLQLVLTSVAGILIMSLVNTFGAQVTAAYGIGMQVDSLSFLPGMAVGMSVSSMVAQNLGAARYDRVRAILGWSMVLATVMSGLCFALVMLMPGPVASVFTTDPVVVAHTKEYLRIVAFSYFTFAWMFVLQGVVRGAGDTMVMLLISFIAIVVVRYPLAVVLARQTSWKEHGIWVSVVASTAVGAVLNYVYYLSGRWRKRVVGGRPVASTEEVAA